MTWLTTILLALSCLLRPHRAQCPADRDLRTGIRRDGHFECWSHPVGSPEWDGTWGKPERSVQIDDAVTSRIHCTNGQEPIIIDARTVGCQQRH